MVAIKKFEWPHPKKQRHWLGSNGELPSYTEVACSLLSYDQVIVLLREAEELVRWLQSDRYLLELLRNGLIGFIDYSDYPQLRDEDLISTAPEIYQLKRHIATNGDVFSFPKRDELHDYYDIDNETLIGLTKYAIENGDRWQSSMWPSEQLCALHLVTHHGITASFGPEEMFAFDMLFPAAEQRFGQLQAVEALVLQEFGIPIPIRPKPDQLMKFREASAHVAFRDFIEKLHRRSHTSQSILDTRHHIIDEIEHQFQIEMRKGRFRTIATGLICTGIDAGLAATGVPVPVSSTLSMLFDMKKKKLESAAPSLVWRSFFRRWSDVTLPATTSV